MEIDDALIPTGFLDSSWISKSSHSFQGDSVSSSTAMAGFENSPLENGRIEGLFPYVEKEKNVNEGYDPYFHRPEKKRRLSSDQVQYLEKSFEVENKLEPERKVRLAKDLGLHPRQIAIWFQNRRARYKTKQLEKDYDSLKASYDKLKVDFDSLSNENAILKFEVESLKEKLLVDPEATQELNANATPISHNMVNANAMFVKQEDANSAKSDVVDSDSPHCVDGNHISSFQPVDSTRVLEADISSFSQEEEEDFCRILPPPCLPIKIESFDDLNEDNCNLGNSVDDQTFWFWS